MSNLQKYLLKDIATTQTGPFGSQLHEEDYVNVGTPIVTVEHLGEIGFIVKNLPRVSNEDKIRLSRYILKEGDIVFSRVGSIDRCTYVSKNEDGWMYSGRCLRVRFNEKANAKFISFYFRQKYFKEMMLNISVGATMPSLNTTLMANIPLYLPPLPCQNKIASVLSALDSKIKLNNRINAELEAMAKTLYDYWFVQFDFPAANGKPYKTSGGKMVWNEELKREIPEGWGVDSIEHCCLIIDCLHSKKSDFEYEADDYFLLQLENIKDDGLLDLTNKYFVTKSDYIKWTSRIEVKEDDILITNAGRVAATAQMPNGIISGIGRNITAIRPTSIRPTYLFLSFHGADLKRQIKINTDSGAFFTSLNVKGIKKLFILRPDMDIEKKFENIVHPLRRKRELNNTENQQLSSLRDWLLPMLMNGQVTVGGSVPVRAIYELGNEVSMAAEPDNNKNN